MKMDSEPKCPQRRLTARYEGHVQGVGFRFTTVQLARGLNLRGFVQNEMDGSVTVVAEGPEDALMALLRALKASSLGRHIISESLAWSAPTDEFSVFSVGFGG